MDGAGAGDDKPSPDMENPSPNPPSPPAAAAGDDAASAAAAAGGRRPFTSLSQEEADLALARVLQEQERAYMMLTGQGGGGYVYYDDYDEQGEEEEDDDDVSDYEEEEEGDAIDEDEEAEAGLDLDEPVRYGDDDDVAGRLSMALAGIGDWRTMEQGDDGEEEDGEEEEEEDDDQQNDAWEDVDPDEYSYEELIALGEVVGTESKGLPADTIASLPSVTYQAQDTQDGNMEQCVICRVEFEEGESLVALPCKHPYHSECINHWLQLNKVCPMCSAEVSSSDKKESSAEVSSVNKKAA